MINPFRISDLRDKCNKSMVKRFEENRNGKKLGQC